MKQYLVRGSEDPGDEKLKHRAFFILATCAQNARKDFEERFGLKVAVCIQTAESGYFKEDLDTHDFWKEKLNWELEIPETVESESQKRYFAMKLRAEKVAEAKKKFKVTDWDTVTNEQIDQVRRYVSEGK